MKGYFIIICLILLGTFNPFTFVYTANECQGLSFGESCGGGKYCLRPPGSAGNEPLTCIAGVLDDEEQQSKEGTVSLENPLSGDITDVPTLIGTVIKAALGIVGALSLYMFIVGGFTWLISAGNPERVKSGAKMMLWAAIGVLVTFVSYLALSTLIKIYLML